MSDIFQQSRNELSEINQELAKIDQLWEMRRPILVKRRDALLAFTQAFAETIDTEQKLKKDKQLREIPSLRVPESTAMTVAAPFIPRPEHPLAKPVKHSAGNQITDDLIITIAEMITAKGMPMTSGEIYRALLEMKKISEYEHGARVFGLQMTHYAQSLILFERRVWGLPHMFDAKAPSQEEIHTKRPYKKNLEDPRWANLVASTNGHTNGHSSEPKPVVTADKMTFEQKSEDNFVVALNCIFRDMDNRPIGARQMWEIVIDDNFHNLTGVDSYEQFQAKLQSFPDFFVRDEAGLYSPLHGYEPDPKVLAVLRNGKEIVAA